MWRDRLFGLLIDSTGPELHGITSFWAAARRVKCGRFQWKLRNYRDRYLQLSKCFWLGFPDQRGDERACVLLVHPIHAACQTLRKTLNKLTLYSQDGGTGESATLTG